MTVGFVLLMAAAMYLGRTARLPDTALSLVWPASGVAVWWMLALRTRRLRLLDCTALALVVAGVNIATGAPLLVATVFGPINLANGLVGALILSAGGFRLHGRAEAHHPFLLLGAAAAAGLSSGLLSAAASAWLTDAAFWSTFQLVAVRNGVSTFLIVSLVWAMARPGALRRLGGFADLEWAAAIVVGTATYLLVFGWVDDSPLAFLALPIAVWFGARLGLARATVLSFCLGALAVALSVTGSGAFGGVVSTTSRALLIQSFVATTVFAVTALAALNEQREREAASLAATKELLAEAISSALIGNAIVDIRPDEPCGRLIRPNPALARLFHLFGADGDGPYCWASLLAADQRSVVSGVLHGFSTGSLDRWTGELRHVLRDGTEVWAQVHLSLLALPTILGQDGGAGRRPDGAPSVPLVAQFLDITARRDAETQLSHMALHDDLTGLPNRVLLRDRVEHALAACPRSGQRVALLFLDLDHFKDVNDSLGHEAGDAVLRAVADRLRGAVRPADTVARIGGDEFVVCLAGVADAQSAEQLTQRVAAAVSQVVVVQDRRVPVGVSVGLAVSVAGDDASSLLRQSDSAMYQAKRSGRGRVSGFVPDLVAQADRHLRVRDELEQALTGDQLVLHYQPVVDLATGRMTACEALVRWQHPVRGLLYPREWLDVAEEGGLMPRLGGWVLDRACHDMAEYTAENGPLRVHVNVSGKQLNQAGFVEQLECAVAASTLRPESLVLELTETHLLDVQHSLLKDLARLEALGVSIAVDDFGTGYSTLTQLVQLPVGALKIDRSFVSALTTDARSAAVVRGVLAMGEALDLEVVAEGVETPEQATALRALGCRSAQGYLWSPGVPVDGLHQAASTGPTSESGFVPGGRLPRQDRSTPAEPASDQVTRVWTPISAG
ncbi:EAL domain-containing protein [Aquipuribacter sp. MA13-6]|uniref:bifunctional diguanylate cyclase/phosphodiesterase n=1 Tax=unclassified Aquipuribacter TaxID=2635084 RepID=UPI003EEC3CBD